MPDIVAIRRQMTARAIAQNPVEISLSRPGLVQRVPDGAGGFIETPGVLPPQVFRIYVSSRHGTRNISGDAAQVQINLWEMLCSHDADILRGDEFELHGRKYRLHKVNPIRAAGEIVSYQVDLEEVV